jgi:Ca2+-transporting ATPase
VLSALQTQPDGLTDAVAAERLAATGPNALPAPARASALSILAAQLRSIIVFLLVVAIVISLLFGDRIEAAAIGVVLVINTLIGFITEYRARGAMDALLHLQVPRASVVRDGVLRGIDARDLVPGDVIEIDAGHHLPADARLIRAADLRVDEASLTGESMPVGKSHAVVLAADTPLADRTNMVYTGTAVTAGLARAVVTATGPATELGRIGTLTSGVTEERTPLERKLDALGRRLVWLTLAVAAVVGGLGVMHGLPLHAVIETAIALAVAAVPEALPAVATIALAVGMSRMARRHALVRRLPAVESLGSTTVVCTDKTRTLTSGDMAVVRVHAGGIDVAMSTAGAPIDATAGVVRLLETAALASRPQAEGGAGGDAVRVDPVDRAMLRAAGQVGVHRAAMTRAWPEAGLLPFSSVRKLMATFHRVDGRLVAFVKGAPGAVAAICGANDARDLLAVNEQLAAGGLRVLAVARGDVTGTTAEALHDLTMVGLIGLADPPAPGVKDTIDALRRASLRTVMLTGDQQLTAEVVGRELGMIDPGDTAIDGRALDRMTPAELADAVTSHGVFCRITPEHKLTIIRALQSRGEIVAMLGDGVNDAAALKQADVGVSMGRRGTDVAKQAAAIVLQDDRFETIAAAVEEGRVIFDNIRKFVFYLFSCNVAEILVLLVSSLAGLPLPLLPLQLLWLNLVTDTFPALALALEPGAADVMRRPPRRPEETLLTGEFFGQVMFYGVVITASTLAAFLWALGSVPGQASTIAFMTLAFAQIGHLGNARRHGPVLTPRLIIANPFALAGAGVAIALQLAAYHVSLLADVLGVQALGLRAWGVVLLCGLVPATIGQSVKVWRTR